MSEFHHVNKTSLENEKRFLEDTASIYFCIRLLFPYVTRRLFDTPEKHTNRYWYHHYF